MYRIINNMVDFLPIVFVDVVIKFAFFVCSVAYIFLFTVFIRYKKMGWNSWNLLYFS